MSYIVFEKKEDESLVYPWDKERLMAEQSMEQVLMHMHHSKIEFYPIEIIGMNEELDLLMLEHYPERIKIEYSSTLKCKYPMNICQNCGAKQGQFYVYSFINTKIKK